MLPSSTNERHIISGLRYAGTILSGGIMSREHFARFSYTLCAVVRSTLNVEMLRFWIKLTTSHN